MKQLTSLWARERFGERAAHVRTAVVDALHRALMDAQNAHKEGNSKKLFTFGTTQATRRYECIVEALKEMDGAQIIRPKGSPHELVVLNNNLLYPFRYAKTDRVPIQQARVTERKISGLISELFQCFGPEPSYEQGSLFEPDGPELASEPILTRLPEGTRLVLVAYASNDKAGLLNVWWGEGELLDPAGHVGWLPGRYEQLPLVAPSIGFEGHRGGLSGSLPGLRLIGPAASEPRFDNGAMPAVPLTARTPIEQKNSDLYPPISEPIPEAPIANDEER